MNPDDIKSLVDQLLKTGEILATKAFELSYRQVIVSASVDLILSLLVIIVAAIFLNKTSKKYWEKYSTEVVEDIAQIAAWIGLVIGFIVVACSIKPLLNPEWYAVKLLLDSIVR